jgi:hypothetical protein
VCPGVANGTQACSSGSCVVGSCNPGFSNCNGAYGDGCEINTTNNTSSCGACGNVCPPIANGTQACSGGGCVVGGCNGGFSNCNGSYADGCEINTTNNTSHCGACGNSCGAVCVGNVAATTCAGGSCGVLACNAGFFNVDGVCGNGCECPASVTSNQCAAPISPFPAVGLGQTFSYSGNLVPAGNEAWFIVTFTGNADPSYHPAITLSTNPGNAFQLDVRTNCAGATLTCGVEGGVSNGVTAWETFRPGANGYNIPIPPVGNNGTVLVRVYRKAGFPVTCQSYTLTVKN